jgi:hypothetical protein
MSWQNLHDYAATHGKARNSALALAWRGVFPKATIKRTMAGGRCVLIEIKAGTPWPARNKAKNGEKAKG